MTQKLVANQGVNESDGTKGLAGLIHHSNPDILYICIYIKQIKNDAVYICKKKVSCTKSLTKRPSNYHFGGKPFFRKLTASNHE